MGCSPAQISARSVPRKTWPRCRTRGPAARLTVLTGAPTLSGRCQFAPPRQASLGLTRQTSDDLQFIARFIKVMIIIWIVLTILGIITVPLFFGSLIAAVSGLVPHVAR